MTDRFNALTVVLEHDIREDDAQALISAISQLRGVLSVTGNVADPLSHITEERARHHLGKKLLAVLFPERDQP